MVLRRRKLGVLWLQESLVVGLAGFDDWQATANRMGRVIPQSLICEVREIELA
jgi:hypothetical protein